MQIDCRSKSATRCHKRKIHATLGARSTLPGSRTLVDYVILGMNLAGITCILIFQLTIDVLMTREQTAAAVACGILFDLLYFMYRVRAFRDIQDTASSNKQDNIGEEDAEGTASSDEQDNVEEEGVEGSVSSDDQDDVGEENGTVSNDDVPTRRYNLRRRRAPAE